MYTFAEKQKPTPQAVVAKSTIPRPTFLGNSDKTKTPVNLQRTLGNQNVLRMLQLHMEDANVRLTARSGVIQPRLTVNQPGDEYEQEADCISEKVMATPDPRLQRACACDGACTHCQPQQSGEENMRLYTKRLQPSNTGE